ncbi:MAG: hypothetical protein ACE5EC_03490 [Phycisphaerae bacterium]
MTMAIPNARCEPSRSTNRFKEDRDRVIEDGARRGRTEGQPECVGRSGRVDGL